MIGNTLFEYKELNSTNEQLKQLLNESGVQHGTVVVSESQMAGKGQQNNVWEARPGENLHLSILLEPNGLLADQQFEVSILISLAVRNVVAQALQRNDVKVKWPNDILVDGQKIAGILIENILHGNKVAHSIIGIGINVNQSSFQKYRRAAVSLKMLSNKSFDLSIIQQVLLDQVNQMSVNLGALKQEYLKHLFGFNQVMNIQVNGEVQKLKVVDVDSSGRLFLHDGFQREGPFMFKDVVFLD